MMSPTRAKLARLEDDFGVFEARVTRELLLEHVEVWECRSWDKTIRGVQFTPVVRKVSALERVAAG